MSSIILNLLSGVAGGMSLASVVSVLAKVIKQGQDKRQLQDIEKLYKQINEQRLELERIQNIIKSKELEYVEKKDEYENLTKQIDSLLELYKKGI